MKQVNNVSECFLYRKNCSGSVGLVPTMGALHDGHLSLIKKSLITCDTTIVTIFVNPKQFGKNEDFDDYPSNIKKDLKILSSLNVGCVFVPNISQMYSSNHSFDLIENQLSKLLEGLSRPNFFNGVSTIVAKLLNLFQPTHVFFGEKDAQQLLIIKKMLQDMNYNIQCVSMPTIRDKNGLALSSRNQYLSAKEIKIAANVYRGLLLIQNRLNSGSRHVPNLSSVFINYIGAFSEIKLDYLSFSNLETLEDVQTINNQDVLISVAVYIRSVRLIDNIIYAV